METFLNNWNANIYNKHSWFTNYKVRDENYILLCVYSPTVVPVSDTLMWVFWVIRVDVSINLWAFELLRDILHSNIWETDWINPYPLPISICQGFNYSMVGDSKWMWRCAGVFKWGWEF